MVGSGHDNIMEHDSVRVRSWAVEEEVFYVLSLVAPWTKWRVLKTYPMKVLVKATVANFEPEQGRVQSPVL